jgi:hypothetical protein
MAGGLEFAAEELEETPQPTTHNAPASAQTKPATVRKERRLLRGVVLFEASKRSRAAMIIGYKDAPIAVPAQVSKVYAEQCRLTLQILQ